MDSHSVLRNYVNTACNYLWHNEPTFSGLSDPTPEMKKSSRISAKASEQVGSRFQPATSVSHEAMLVDGNDELFRHVLFLSRLFADRLIMFLEAVARQIGLSGNQYVILLAIAHSQRKGGVTVRDVAGYALMASTHVTTQAGALIRKGLVLKRPNSEDGRSVLLLLTPKGEEAMRRIASLRQEFNDAMFESVSRKSLLDAAKFLEQVTANSEKALPLLERPAIQGKPARQLGGGIEGANKGSDPEVHFADGSTSVKERKPTARARRIGAAVQEGAGRAARRAHGNVG